MSEKKILWLEGRLKDQMASFVIAYKEGDTNCLLGNENVPQQDKPKVNYSKLSENEIEIEIQYENYPPITFFAKKFMNKWRGYKLQNGSKWIVEYGIVHQIIN